MIALSDDDTAIGADEALARLMEGNARFLRGEPSNTRTPREVLADLAKGQRPFATILGCSDSRVPPELVFDQGLGHLFVCRTAGQVLDQAVLGSIQYGVLELGIPLILVLGHEECGAVRATLEARHSAPVGNDIDALVAAISPAVERADVAEGGDPLDRAVRYNVGNVVTALRGNAVLGAAVGAGSLRILGARYGLDDGRVEFL